MKPETVVKGRDEKEAYFIIAYKVVQPLEAPTSEVSSSVGNALWIRLSEPSRELLKISLVRALVIEPHVVVIIRARSSEKHETVYLHRFGSEVSSHAPGDSGDLFKLINSLIDEIIREVEQLNQEGGGGSG